MPEYQISHLCLQASLLHLRAPHQQTGTVTGRTGRASQSCTELHSSPQQFHFTDASLAYIHCKANKHLLKSAVMTLSMASLFTLLPSICTILLRLKTFFPLEPMCHVTEVQLHTSLGNNQPGPHTVEWHCHRTWHPQN